MGRGEGKEDGRGSRQSSGSARSTAANATCKQARVLDITSANDSRRECDVV